MDRLLDSQLEGCRFDSLLGPDVVSLGKALYTNFLTWPRWLWVTRALLLRRPAVVFVCMLYLSVVDLLLCIIACLIYECICINTIVH